VRREREFGDHALNLRLVERRKRDDVMVRPQSPGRPEFGSRRRQNENWRPRATVAQRLHEVNRSRVEPLQILKDENERLVAGAGGRPLDHCGQLTAANLLWRKTGHAVRRDGNADHWGKQRSELPGAELQASEKRFEFGQPPLGRHLGSAEPDASPPDDRVQRRVLQQLRRTPFDPRVSSVGQLAAKLFNQSGLADARLADDQDELPVARKGAFRAASQHPEVLLAADKWREKLGLSPAPSAAYPQDAIEIHWRKSALELVGALILNDEQPSNLLLDSRSNQDCSRLGRSLHTRGDVRRFPEHVACVVDDDGTALDADANRELGSPGCFVSNIDFAERLLDAEGRPDGPLGVTLLRPRIAEDGHQPIAKPFKHTAAEPGHRL
jgi:hypothetical protein